MESKSTPKDFFMHLGAAVGLYVSAVSLINLLFGIINYAFPDSLNYYVDPYSSSMRWVIAMLLIIFPLYLFLLWLVERDVRVDPLKKQLAIRRWLSYLTLFVAGTTLAIDLVVLINNYLGGEITSRFLLKALAVFMVAAAVFWYYLSDLRQAVGAPTTGRRIFTAVSVIFVIASLVTGFLVMGSPATARKMHFDEQRASDLSSIQSQVVYYWQTHNKLPAALDALKDPLTGFVLPLDPQTSASYEYTPTGALTFKLCAEFALKSSAVGSGYSVPAPKVMYDGGMQSSNYWNHEAGKQCFDRTIDPSRYPKNPTPDIRG